MKTFLSIDMDFWNDWGKVSDIHRYLDNLCRDLKKSCVPMTAVMNHQQMLTLVNESKARRLINIDKHSDLADIKVDRLNCGTWISYIKWRTEGQYLWFHKHAEHEGDCNQDPPIFTYRGVKRKISDWGYIGHKKVQTTPSRYYLMNKDITDFSLVLSPAFVDEEFELVFRDIVKKYKMPYQKGRRDEDHQRFITPSGRPNKPNPYPCSWKTLY
jgi:hypothetical protein